MSSNKRSSMAPSAGPKPSVNFSSSLTIPKDAVLVGTHSITMQAETLIHPKSRFDSTFGSIFIGRRCVIHERTQIGIQPPELDKAKPGGVNIGDYVVVETGSIIEAGGSDIGDGSIIQVGSRIGSGAKIGQSCTITPKSVIPPGEVLPDFTIVYSNGLRRIDKRKVQESRKLALVKQINVVKTMIRSDPDKFK